MPKLEQLTKGESTIVFLPFDEATEKVEITYRPHKLTPSVRSKVKASITEGDDGPLAEWLSKLIVSWDVLDDDGDPLPITPETMLELPNQFIGKIFEEIVEDATVPEAKPGT